ncbi:disks large-associated protein 5-like isoform X2 [Panulirus ornatus]
MGVDRELSVAHFRGLLEKEIQTLTNYCSEWKNILKLTSDIPEDVRGDIMVAVGQAELLMKERFSQFKRLIDMCENNQGEKKITCLDLQGFWDIVYFQVEDVAKKFSNLEEIKNNGWNDLEHKPPHLIQKKKMAPFKPFCVKSKKGNSALKAHIMAARQKLLDEKKTESSNELHVISIANGNCHAEDKTVTRAVPARESIGKKTSDEDGKGRKACSPMKSPEKAVFDAGFFRVETPVKENIVAKQFTPGKSEQKVLASTVLKERVHGSPVVHKDYSPCMRVTRSMKAKGIQSRKLQLY